MSNKMSNNLTQEQLKELLHYAPDTGVFTRKVDVCNGKFKEGTRAGSTSLAGYRVLPIERHTYPECHLAWLYVYGEFPKPFLYPLNGDASDNRIENLAVGVDVTDKSLTQSLLKQVAWYDPVEGRLFCKVPTGKKAKAGNPLSTVTRNGYASASLGKKRYLEHRLIWLLHHGAWPVRHLDHINCNKLDNRIENLRECNDLENGQNRAKLNKNNTSGFQGVQLDRRYGTFSARIGSKGSEISLGSFSTAEGAYSAYLKAKAEVHTFNPEAPTPREATCTTSL